MKRWFLALGIFACLLSSSASFGQDKKVLNVCLISGSFEYDSDKSFAKLKALLEKNYNAKCSMASTTKFEELPGLENLNKCDVAVLFTRRLKIEGEQLERLKKYCLSGKPLVGIRTASHGLQNWLELDKEVFGGDYGNHYKDKETKVTVVEKEKDNPILKGVHNFASEGTLYKNEKIAKDCKVLMTGATKDVKDMPVTWTRMYKGGRIFYTSLGHQKDFDDANFMQLMVNAIFWAGNQTPMKK